MDEWTSGRVDESTDISEKLDSLDMSVTPILAYPPTRLLSKAMPKTTWNCVMTDNEARHLDSLCRQVEVTDEDIRGYVNLLINQAYELGQICSGQPTGEKYLTILGKDAQGH